MPTIVTGEDISQPKDLQENTFGTATGQSDETVQNRVEEKFTPTHRTIATLSITNHTVPIVIFIGPASSGKSMILVRLAKYLRDQGYTIKTDPTFLNTDKYHNDCKEFKEKLDTTTALSGTVEYLLVSIYNKSGEEVAKLLEAPGEDFYTTDPQKIKEGVNDSVKPYLSAIMTSSNPKIYVTLTDLDSPISFRENVEYRKGYTRRFLEHFYPCIDIKRDRIILLYNKIDKTMLGNIHGCTNLKGARKDAELNYPQLFGSMKVTGLGGFLTYDNFAFKTFCTGKYSEDVDDFGNKNQPYHVSSDVYPRELWKEITRKF